MSTITDFLDRSEVDEVLRLMCFQCGPPCEIYRAGGHVIKRRAEDEQAFIMRRSLGFVETHGADWRKAMSDEMDGIIASAKAGAAKSVIGDAAS